MSNKYVGIIIKDLFITKIIKIKPKIAFHTKKYNLINVLIYKYVQINHKLFNALIIIT